MVAARWSQARSRRGDGATRASRENEEEEGDGAPMDECLTGDRKWSERLRANMNEGDGALPTSLLNSVTEINHSTSSVVTDSTSNDDTSSLINSPRVCYSPKGSKECIAGCLHHLKPSVGMIFDSLKEAELFYKVYAAQCGFQVRNGTDKKGKQTVGKEIVEVILLKYLLCTKQGYFQPKPRNQDAECSQTQKRSVSCSGCSTCIRLRYSSGGKYVIYCFHEGHSHPFLTPSSIPFTKESRQLTQVQKQYIFNNAKVNIGPVKSYRMSKEHCGSYNNVRGTKTDFKNFYRDLKVYIGDKDAFMFKENFERKCMGNCEPYCLLTDQDPAMSIAIEKVFKTTKPRLCMWHIMRKVPDKVGPVLCRETDFLKKLNAVIWDSDLDPTEFVSGWEAVMKEFSLENHDWLSYMFKIKHKWIPAYFRDLFMGALLRVTSRSEGENNFFCHFTNPHVTLVEFSLRYDSALDAQRHEQDELVKKSKNLPSLVTPLQLEKHASLFYTHALFYEFQQECEAACFACGIESCNSCYGDGEEFSVVYDNERRKNYDVIFDTSSNDSTCSCRKFESEGILCRLILFIIKGKFLCEIPSKYLLRRWSKDALKQPMSNFVGWSFVEDSSRSDRKKQLLSDCWSKMFSCVSLAEDTEDNFFELVEKLSVFEEELKKKKCGEGEATRKDQTASDADILELLVGSKSGEVDVLPPNVCLTKGSGRSSKRLKSAKEKAVEVNTTAKKGRTCKACGQSGDLRMNQVQPNDSGYC
ncbi:protein FAR1-RELATED SEQUENCE 1-like [Spinacia oleracea]|uniref:Protein FAR1-RELATED SEQUENCE 1-like n=1 Tax=Spinacia oleracea TaxID=3562 RepID=A0ABM3RHW5_SPIOL|nr:protein FAR1-RELATED SEQUENCE 1-like [Spinacia oleracea]